MVSVNPNVNVDFNVSANKYQTFGAGKKQNFTHDNKPTDDDRMKTSTKLMIGATAIGTVIAAALLGRHLAWKNAANELGIENVETFKILKKKFYNVKKLDGKINDENIHKKIGSLSEKLKLETGDYALILPREYFNDFEKLKDCKDLPQNCVLFTIKSKDDKIKYTEVIFHDGLEGECKTAFEKGEYIKIPIEIE